MEHSSKLTGRDTRGRRNFYDTERDYSIAYDERALRWFEFLNLHGPLNTAYLHDLTKGEWKDKGRALDRMLDLKTGGYIALDEEQRNTDRAIYNRYIYSLTEHGRAALMQEDRYVETLAPTKVARRLYRHQYLTACVTASVHLWCLENGYTYIPGHELVQPAATTLRYDPLKLVPDQLFAIDYGASWRLYAVEADLGTEPVTTTAHRKSLRGSIEKYAEYIDNWKFKEHLAVDTGMICLYVFISKGRQNAFLKETAKVKPKFGSILSQTVQGFYPPSKFKPLPPYTHLNTDGWQRAGMRDYFIHEDGIEK